MTAQPFSYRQLLLLNDATFIFLVAGPSFCFFLIPFVLFDFVVIPSVCLTPIRVLRIVVLSVAVAPTAALPLVRSSLQHAIAQPACSFHGACQPSTTTPFCRGALPRAVELLAHNVLEVGVRFAAGDDGAHEAAYGLIRRAIVGPHDRALVLCLRASCS